MRKRYKYIDYLKAIASILVVLGHSISYFKEFYPIGNILYITEQLIYAMHVPLFFVISGYLCHTQEWKGYIQKKIYRVLIPFYMFSIFKLIYSYLFVELKPIDSQQFFHDIVEMLLYGNTYWFSYCLFIFYLIAPLFWNWNKKYILFISICFVMANFFVNIYHIEIMEMFQFSKAFYYIVYFLLGMWINKKGIINSITEVLRVKKGIVIINIVLISILLCFRIHKIGSVITEYILAVLLIIQSYDVIIHIQDRTIIDKIFCVISKYSYQIMLFDSLFKIALYKVVEKVCNINVQWIFILSIFNIILSCVCCRVIEQIPYIRNAFGLAGVSMRKS